MKKLLLLSLLSCCFFLNINKTLAQIGYNFDSSVGKVVKSGDLKNVISNLSTFTIEFWAKKTNDAQFPMMVSIYSNNVAKGGFATVDGYLVASLNSTFADYATIPDFPTTITTDDWHHFAYVFNAGKWDFYFDGASIGENTDNESLSQTPNYAINGPTFFYFGGQSGVYDGFDGNMDDIRIWNTARTASQINGSRMTELTGSETGLVLNYKFNEQSGQVVTDSGPNGLHGVLGNSNDVETVDPIIKSEGKATGNALASTNSATNISATSVSLHGSIHDNGNATTTSFEYGTNSSLVGASTINATPATITAGTGSTGITANLTGLTPSTTYYYRSKGVNASGTTTGAILNFNTLGQTSTITIGTNNVTAPFSTSYGTPSDSKSFTISGSNLSEAVTITPPSSAFELSTDNTNFSSSLTVGAAGNFGPTTVYIRIAARAPYTPTSITGNITFSSTGLSSPPSIPLPLNTLVTKAPLVITASNQTRQYGSENLSFVTSISGFKNGDGALSLTTLPTLSSTVTATSSVAGSPYPITANGASAVNYSISYVQGTLTVTPAPLTITATNQTKVYGSVLPNLTASYTGFVNGDTPISLTTPPTITTTASAASHVSGSPYVITASGAVSSNYSISYQTGSLTITTATLLIKADNQVKKYGEDLPTLTATYTGFANGDTPSSLSTQPTLITTAIGVPTVAGSPYTISFIPGASSDYNIIYESGQLTITRAPLTISPQNYAKAYGEAMPTILGRYVGFADGEGPLDLITPPTFSTAATAASSVSGGPYLITANGASAANYEISYGTAHLTVTPAPLTITAINETKVYGSALPNLTASYTGFVNGDTPNSLTTAPTLSTSATNASSTVGSPYVITASGAVGSNYSISYQTGTLTVTPAPLYINVNSETKVYGDAVPPLTATYIGFVNGDTPSSLTTAPTLTTTATAASHIADGPFDITASGAVSSDYNISYMPGSLSVTQAVLTITADNQTKKYGEQIPTLTATYSGFVNGDTPSNLLINPTLTTSATAASTVAGSPYPIGFTTGLASDYDIRFEIGDLTVTPAPLTISAQNHTKAYGEAMPTILGRYVGFVNGETSIVLTTRPTYTTAATAASSVAGGPYLITARGASADNYEISYGTAHLTVSPVDLTITANNQTKTYGDQLPALTASYSGLVNGDTPSSLTTAPTLTTTATAASSVLGNPYTITASGANSPNYNISYGNGDLTITTAPLTIIADNQTKKYGEQLPTLTASYLGFVNGDTPANLTTPPTLTTTATATSSAIGGPYLISASGASSSDYNIGYNVGVLLIDAAAQNITFAALANKLVTDPIFSLMATVSSNLAVNYTSSDPTIARIINGNQIEILKAGVINITASQAGNENYLPANNVVQSLTIIDNPPPIISIASSKGNHVSKGETAILTASGALTYQWSNSNGIIGTQNSASLTVRPSQNTIYTVTGFNEHGRSSTQSFSIEVLADYKALNIMNVLTPDGDGKNDTWVVENLDMYPNNHVRIFDRSGKLIFEKKGYDNSWNATLNGSVIPKGAYLYVIDFGPGIGIRKGYLTIIGNN